MRNTFKSTYRSFIRRRAIYLINLIGIALLPVSWQSWNATMRNPVKALRYE